MQAASLLRGAPNLTGRKKRTKSIAVIIADPSGARPAARAGRPAPESARERILAALDSTLSRSWPFSRDRADLVLDAGADGRWTLQVRGRRVFVHPGAYGRHSAVVETDASTLAELLEGRRSGTELWLSGALRVRGSIALALQLEGLIQSPARQPHFPHPRRVTAYGIDTFLLEAGQGPPVVLLHGLGATNASMLPTMHDLAADHRVIAPDLPGFGDSAKPVRAYHARFFARWVVALLDELGIERAHLIGNSMGGRIAIEVALSHPDRVERLALYAPAVAFRKLRQFVPLVRLLRPELAAVPMAVPRSTVINVLEQMFSRGDRLQQAWYQAATDEFLRVFSSRRGRIAFFSAAREIYLDHPFGERGFWNRLRELSRPALFLWGDRDPLVPARFARHVQTGIPAAESVVLDDCGHVPQFEHPALTHRLVRDFFDV